MTKPTTKPMEIRKISQKPLVKFCILAYTSFIVPIQERDTIMELISVRELFKNTDAYAGKEVTIGGWVRNRRPSKQFGFIVLNDGTYFTPV